VDITESLRGILKLAFRVMSPAQLVGPWKPFEAEPLVDIHATLPAGATIRQVPEMLQQLLTERFRLVTHRESCPMDAYELVVGMSGTTMREVEAVDELKKEFSPDPALKTPSVDRTEETPLGTVRTIVYPAVNKIVTITSQTMYERNLNSSGSILNATRVTMAELVKLLEETVSQHVVDGTGLKGVYQFTLELPQSPIVSRISETFERVRAGVGGDLATPTGSVSVKFVETLGLKLEKKRLPIEVLVVDKIAPTPTEN
jgi:uncharacterized protein (TIGR03435 family)